MKEWQLNGTTQFKVGPKQESDVMDREFIAVANLSNPKNQK